MSAERLPQPSDPGELPNLPMPSDVVHGRYRVESELGRGGMGVVLAAHDEMLDRSVALKVMLPKMMCSRDAIDRFVNEARSLARLDSRHVVRVLDFGSISQPPGCAGLPFMVLELLHGEDLFSVAARHGGLSPSRVVRYALEACAGLAAAHALGIVHRDLKPENLFLAIEPDGSECLKVLDFGIARSHSRRALTQGQMGVGSPGYMSPEQVEASGHVDARSDIWALGVVMYELLAHRPAFIGDNPQSLCLQILSAPVTPLSELRPELPPALVYIIERCMEREPSRRFANVAELAEALTPLDDWTPTSEAELIRRRLDASDEPPIVDEAPTSAVRLQETRSLSSSDIIAASPLSQRAREPRAGRAPNRRRRIASVVAAGLMLTPAVALLPGVAEAPQLAPARAWSSNAVTEARAAWQAARARAHELWMREPAGQAAP